MSLRRVARFTVVSFVDCEHNKRLSYNLSTSVESVFVNMSEESLISTDKVVKSVNSEFYHRIWFVQKITPKRDGKRKQDMRHELDSNLHLTLVPLYYFLVCGYATRPFTCS